MDDKVKRHGQYNTMQHNEGRKCLVNNHREGESEGEAGHTGAGYSRRRVRCSYTAAWGPVSGRWGCSGR